VFVVERPAYAYTHQDCLPQVRQLSYQHLLFEKLLPLPPAAASLPQWNPEDKEFNCPCHGSCFSAEGKNLAGPATIDMSRID
jgi:Rieske Fe-S protein